MWEEGLGGRSRALQLRCLRLETSPAPSGPLCPPRAAVNLPGAVSLVALLTNLPRQVFTDAEGREGKILDKRGRF